MIVQVEITDLELACFKHDVLESPQEWLTKAWRGKAASCMERMTVREWLPRLVADPAVTSIPADMGAMVDMITRRPDYLDRAGREAMQKAIEEAKSAQENAPRDA